MRLYQQLLVVWLAKLATANVLAGPYQTIYYWYTYRMELLQFGFDHPYRKVAAYCVGSMPDKSCNFDEFIKHILNPQSVNQWDNKGLSSPVGNDLEPDVEETARWLRENEYPTARVPNNPNLSLNLPNNGNFGSTMTEMERVINEARVAKGDAALGKSLTAAREALEGVIHMREADMAKGWVDRVQTFLKGQNIIANDVPTRQVVGTHGRSYNAVDWFKVYKDWVVTGRGPGSLTEKVRAWKSQWPQNKNDRQMDLNHRDAIAHARKSAGAITAPAVACSTS